MTGELGCCLDLCCAVCCVLCDPARGDVQGRVGKMAPSNAIGWRAGHNKQVSFLLACSLLLRFVPSVANEILMDDEAVAARLADLARVSLSVFLLVPSFGRLTVLRSLQRIRHNTTDAQPRPGGYGHLPSMDPRHGIPSSQFDSALLI